MNSKQTKYKVEINKFEKDSCLYVYIYIYWSCFLFVRVECCIVHAVEHYLIPFVFASVWAFICTQSNGTHSRIACAVCMLSCENLISLDEHRKTKLVERTATERERERSKKKSGDGTGDNDVDDGEPKTIRRIYKYSNKSGSQISKMKHSCGLFDDVCECVCVYHFRSA